MAVNTLVNITQDEIEYARMSNLIKSQLDYQSGMVGAKREGLAEGLEQGLEQGLKQGLEQGKMETARNLKSLGVSTDIIIKSTGLSPEEIAEL